MFLLPSIKNTIMFLPLHDTYDLRTIMCVSDVYGKLSEHVSVISLYRAFVRFCMSTKDGTGGGGWVHPKGVNSMAVSGVACRKALVGSGRAISVLFGINGLRNKPS